MNLTSGVKMFEVFIEENSRYADENERCKIGEFDDFAAAIKVCRKIVDDFLAANYKDEMTAENLYQIYKMFGEDAFIVGDLQDENFSAWDYARKRCREICENE